MFCKNCGRTMDEGEMFCPECGKPVDETVIFVKPNQGKDDKTEKKIEAQEIRPESKLASIIKEEESAKQKIEKQKVSLEDVVQSPVPDGNLINYIFCANCGAKNDARDAFCYSCGSPLSGQVPPQSKQSQADSNNVQSAKVSGIDVKIKKINRKARKGKDTQGGNKIIIAISAVVIVLLILCIVLAVSIIGGTGRKNLVLYLKDNELTQYAGKQALSLDDDIIDGDYTNIHWLIQSTEDKSLIYYPRNYRYNGYDLYCVKSGAKAGNEKKIDSNVVRYKLLDNGKVIYIKDSNEKKMYVYDGDQSTKIASGVSDFMVSENEKVLLWLVDDSDGSYKIYYSKSDWANNNEKIASDVSYIICYSDNLNEIFYKKADVLYLVKEFSDPVKIASNIDSARFVKVDGECSVYYTKEADELSYLDLFEDNYYESDKSISEPDITNYQHEETNDSFWGPITETVTEDAYYDKYQEYNEKQQRDYLRESIKNETQSLQNLYAVNNKGESVLLDTGMILNIFTDNILSYEIVRPEGFEKINLFSDSQTDYADIRVRLEQAIRDSIRLCYLADGKVITINYSLPDDNYVEIVSSGAVINTGKMYFEIEQGENGADIYEVNYEKKGSEASLFAEESYIESITDDGIYYYKNYNAVENVGDLYFNDSKIDSDISYVKERNDDNSIIYMTDIDSDGDGTLKIYKNGKSEKIADDVSDAALNDKNQVLFLEDYNYNKHYGDLKLFNGSESRKVDTDVEQILYFE